MNRIYVVLADNAVWEICADYATALIYAEAALSPSECMHDVSIQERVLNGKVYEYTGEGVDLRWSGNRCS